MKIGKLRILGACLAAGAALAGSPAWADVVCQGNGGQPLVKAFELSTNSDVMGWSKDAAIILSTGTSKILLTGKVATTPTRVGSNVQYTVTGATAAESLLSYSSRSFDPDFSNCTRAGCDNLAVVQFPGTFVHAGETYALQCQTVSL